MNASKHRFFSKLQRASHLMKKAADRGLLDVGGVTTAQAAVLAVVAYDKQTTQKMVATALGLNESAVVAMVERLRKQGAIERTRSDEDKRIWVLSLTAEGRALLDQINGPFAEINERTDRAVGLSEIDLVATALDRIIDEFSK